MNRWGWLIAWMAVTGVTLWVRGPIPLDETRYLSVAWEMWLSDDFLVPRLNGEPYSHKPPLLFWLIHLGWASFGVNGWWPRIISPLFALAILFALPHLGRKLWPQHPGTSLAPWFLAGTLYWAAFTPMLMFDIPLTACVLASLGFLWHMEAQGKGWLGLGLALGAGLLMKGPPAVLPAASCILLAPWWKGQVSPAWYARAAGAFAIAGGIALAWALPAALSGGPDYARAILWTQTAHRVVESFAHRHPWWWYLPWLPLLFLPWSLWPTLWRRFSLDQGSRFCLAWVLPPFLALSLASGKQLHYLLPLFPGVILLAIRAIPSSPLETPRLFPLALILLGISLAILPFLGLELPPGAHPPSPLWGVGIALLGWMTSWKWEAIRTMALATALGVALLTGAVFDALGSLYDVKPIARFLANLQRKGVPIAHVGKYHGQYHFLGRLHRPFEVLPRDKVGAWAARHPEGYVIRYESSLPEKIPAFIQPYRGHWVAVWRADML